MEYLIGIAVGAIIFGVYYLIGKAISKKILYGTKIKYLLVTFLLFVVSLLIFSLLSGISFEDILGEKQAYFYYAATIFGSYYGLKNSEVLEENVKQDNFES